MGNFKIARKPFELLGPLVRVGILKSDILASYIDVVQKGFQIFLKGRQIKVVADDLLKCNRSAWILPEYLAYDLSRDLKMAGKHSDVGTNALSKPTVYFFYIGLVPTSIYKRTDLVSSAALFQWWQGFINKTHLENANTCELPQKPNMAGNIQLIFILFGGGLILAFSCMILNSEIHFFIVKFVIRVYSTFSKTFTFFKRCKFGAYTRIRERFC